MMRCALTRLMMFAAVGFTGAAGAGTATVLAAPGVTIAIPKIEQAPPIDGDLSNSAWQKAAKVGYAYDLRLHKQTSNVTTALVMTDGKFLYVGFDAKQDSPVTAAQHTNNVGLDTDDEVQIDLWPGGSNGFRYLFISTPLGTHYQFSSENDAYEPNWDSAGKLQAQGYSVTMRIPLNAMRGAKEGAWRVQFARQVQNTHEDLVWNHGTSQGDHNDVMYAGYLAGMPEAVVARPKSRFAVYTLGQVAAQSLGGPTSRSGADVSIPITASSSLYATFHPDFSNVEADQQTIAPTAFRRNVNEVRPFFTQAAAFFNPFSSVGYYVGDLYTPSIPTPREGYAIEGKQGPFSFAGFDAVGVGRNDAAQVLTWHRPDRKIGIKLQRVAVDMPGFKDDVVSTGVAYDNLINHFFYATYGNDKGTSVINRQDAQRYEAGFGLYSPTSFLGGAVRKVGTYYNPFDGTLSLNGIGGYTFNGSKDFLFSKPSKWRRFSIFGFMDHYMAKTGGLAEQTWSLGTEITTYSKWRLHAEIGSAYLQTNGAPLLIQPITQNLFSLTYHDTTSTPTQMSLARGRFGPGYLDSWTRSTTMRAGQRGTVTLEADNTAQYLDGGGARIQWFDKASYAYQLNRDSSVAVGIRKIIGTPPLLSYQQPDGVNIAAAYHGKVGPWELYAAYGDANATTSTHSFLVKLIRYIGADKGT